MNDLKEFWEWALRLDEPWKVDDVIKMANKALNDTKCTELKLAVNRMKARYLLLRNPRKMSE